VSGDARPAARVRACSRPALPTAASPSALGALARRRRAVAAYHPALRRAAPWIAALCLAAPSASRAQGFRLAAPSISDALRELDSLRQLRARGGLASDGLGQTFVLPERPGQNQVAWYPFEWHQLDVPSPSGGQGGIRLYYYGREHAIAEQALAVIRGAYLRLVERFHYTPTRRIPFILYASQREFQTTNLFQISESVLGVTSPRDLKMALPYLGDHELFREVATHELAHQFTIQKLRDLAEGAGRDSAIESFPLWFVEGLAEYYAKDGLDPESDRYLRDLVWNPDPEHHYEVTSFADDRLRGFIPTYKLGQARLTFVAEVYGVERLQAFLEEAYLLDAGEVQGRRGFAALTRRVLDEPVEEVDVRWRTWLRQRYYPEYLRLRQDLAQLAEVRDLPAEVEDFVAAPDGRLVLFRGIDRAEGRARLYLVDARRPKGAVEVVADDQPGVESLHPIEHSVMAISRERLAYSAQSGAGDVLYLQEYRHQAPAAERPPALELGDRRKVAVRHPAGRSFLEISDLAFSPDGTALAFVGLTDSGQADVYTVSRAGGTARQLTDDAFFERDLAWGQGGIYCSSDATDHHHFNLFRIDPATGARTRLTTGAWDDRHPQPRADGSLLFASQAAGKPDLYLLQDGRIRRLTDFATGLTLPATALPDRSLWAGTFYRGRFRLVEVPRLVWLDEPAAAVSPAAGPALDFPREAIPALTPPYRAYSLGNWRPEAGVVYGAGAAGGVAGRAAILFADLLRDRVLYLDVAVLGSFDLTQAVALLEDRSGRASWVVGAYHLVNEQIDLVNPGLTFFQREFGAVGTLRFPLDRFQRFEVELSASALQRYCLTDFSVTLPTSCGASQAADPSWHRRNDGTQAQLAPVLRYGYDAIRYDPYTGPISGTSLLAELGGSWLPGRSVVSGFARADAARYWRIVGRMNFGLRLAGGTSFAPSEEARNWERVWWLSSADNLRGYGPFDLAQLIGRGYYVVNAELQVPLSPFVRLPLFDYLEAVGAFDFGGVFSHARTRAGCRPNLGTCSDGRAVVPDDVGAWDARTLTAVLGVNALLGPLLFRVHFGHPFDIGGVRTPAQQGGTSWVTNFTLRYFFF